MRPKAIAIIALMTSQLALADAPITPLQQIEKISAYNATILGYAVYCNEKPFKVDAVKNEFVAIINEIPLKKDDYAKVQSSFRTAFENAKDKGPSQSNMTCSDFSPKFEKIYSSVDKDRIN